MSRQRCDVLFYLPEMKVGGAEISLLRLAQGLREHGVAPLFAVHRADADARALAADLPLVSLQAGRTVAALGRLVALLRERRPRVLLAALTHANILAAVAARVAGTGTRVVLTEHAPVSSMAQLDGSRTYRWTLAAMPWAYRLADAVVAVSVGVHDDIAPRLAQGTLRRFSIIPNPVLRSNWRALSEAGLAGEFEEFHSPGLSVVLAVGRLSPEKNFPLLLRAFAAIAASVPQARLAIIGEGPERARLERLIEELGLVGRARLLGQRDNPFAFMRRSRLFVLTSRFEGFGNVLIEAMACGVPVISTDCPVGPREILCDGRYGTLVPSDDVTALAEAMRAALADPRPAEGAYERALQFTAEQSVVAYLALFRSLVGETAFGAP